MNSNQDSGSGSTSASSPSSSASSDLAELSTISSQIEELTARIVEVADSYRGTDEEHIAIRLYEVERSLQMARRNMQSAVRAF